MMPERTVYTARLTGRRLIAKPSETYLLHFEIDEGPFAFTPGQFVSVVREGTYPEGHTRAGEPREETRAYSLADREDGNRIALCLNRVGGFSSLLCDLALEETIRFHGPHGTFVRREGQQPSLYLAAEAGIVPVRAIFRDGVPAHSTLMQLAATREDLLFREEFAASPGLRYLPLIAPDAAFVEAQLRRLLEAHPEIQTAYLCGLQQHIGPVRDLLKALGWDRRQIVFERYD